MKKAYIFGAGATGKSVYDKQKDYQILGVIDNDEEKWGKITYEELTVFSPNKLLEDNYDEILLASLAGYTSMVKQLLDMGIPESKINKKYIDEDKVIIPRITFLESFRKLSTNVEGNVAEVGVFQGEFAKEINRVFADRKLYLFDTFEGFAERDIHIEKEQLDECLVCTEGKHFAYTSEELVLGKMMKPENCVIRKGYFPETSVGLEEEKFCFVNLDVDLYEPTMAGLRFFYPRMVEGGCLLVHDYFSKTYPNVKNAISDFEKEIGERMKKIPIGDTLSIAIVF